MEASYETIEYIKQQMQSSKMALVHLPPYNGTGSSTVQHVQVDVVPR